MEEGTASGLLPRYTASWRRVRAAVWRRPTLREIWSWLLMVGVVILVLLVFTSSKTARLQRGASWGILVLAGMAGWGCLVERIAFPQRVADLGLRLIWGFGALIAVGGVLCTVSAATMPVLRALVLVGAAGWVLERLLSARRGVYTPDGLVSSGWPPGALLGLAALLVLAFTYFLAGASGSTLNFNDDQNAYLVFPRELLATGTFLEPFSLRRLTALGGHSFLQGLSVAAAASPLQISMFDLGLSLFITIALVLGAPDPRTPRSMKILWLMPVMLMVGLPNVRANSASEMSGVAIFVGLYRTASWKGFTERPLAGAVVLGMLAAAACTLRQSYLVPVAVFLVVFYLPIFISALRTDGPERARKLAAVGACAGATVFFLIPWAVFSYRSHGTFLFPLMTGNYRNDYVAMKTHSPLHERIRFFWLNICHCSPIRSIPFFLLAGALIPSRKTRGALPALLWATIIGFVTVIYSLPMSDEKNNARYYFGFAVAAVVAVMLGAFSALPRRRSVPLRAQHMLPVVFAAAAIVAHIQEMRDVLYHDYLKFADVITNAHGAGTSLIPHDETYRALQATVPPGAKFLVMLDEPFWLNFRRNRIDIVDLPGATSPPPGMPLEDDEKLATYLHNLGYRYAAFVRPASSRSLYKRTLWTRNLTAGELPIWKQSAPFYLKMFDRWDGLALTRAHLYDDGAMVALDLETRIK